jgi:hypothetical protein
VGSPLGKADRRALGALSPREWCLLGLSALLLPCAGVALRVAGYTRVEAWARRMPMPMPRRRPDDGPRLAAATARMVTVAADRLPVTSRCLSRSLVLWTLLRAQGVDGELRFGARRDAGELKFHAWVEYGGRPLNDAADVGARFTTLHVVAVTPDPARPGTPRPGA